MLRRPTVTLATVLSPGFAPRLLGVLLPLVARERRGLSFLQTTLLRQLDPELLVFVAQRRVLTAQRPVLALQRFGLTTKCRNLVPQRRGLVAKPLVRFFQRIRSCAQLPRGLLELPDQASSSVDDAVRRSARRPKHPSEPNNPAVKCPALTRIGGGNQIPAS